jgi:hypothetical protein
LIRKSNKNNDKELEFYLAKEIKPDIANAAHTASKVIDRATKTH